MAELFCIKKILHRFDYISWITVQLIENLWQNKKETQSSGM